MVNRYYENWSAPRSNNVNRISVECEWRGSPLFFEEKFLNLKINGNDIDVGEKMVVVLIIKLTRAWIFYKNGDYEESLIQDKITESALPSISVFIIFYNPLQQSLVIYVNFHW